MGRILDIFERYQMQLWSLIDTHTEFTAELHQESLSIGNDGTPQTIGYLLNEFERRLWEMVPMQLKCYTALMGMAAESNAVDVVVKQEDMQSMNFVINDVAVEQLVTNNGSSFLIYEQPSVKPKACRKSKCTPATNANSNVEKPKEVKLRRYVCDVCQKAFARHSYYIIHQRYHTNERPYECEICKRAFHRTDALRRHIQLNHLIKRPTFG